MNKISCIGLVFLLVSSAVANRPSANHSTPKNAQRRGAGNAGANRVEQVAAPAGGVACQIAANAGAPEPSQEKPVRTLVLRGGGFEPNMDELLAIQKARGVTKPTAVVLSATRTGNPNDIVETGKILKFYEGQMGQKLVPLFTRAEGDFVSRQSLGALALDQNANADSNVRKIQEAGSVIVAGGYTPELRHLGGTKTAAAIKEAYLKGTPVYANSAGLSMIGSVYTWQIPKLQNMSAGFGLVDGAVLSHATDLKNNPLDLNLIVPNTVKSGLGLTTTTIVVIENDRMKVMGTDPAVHRVFVNDPTRFPASKKPRCDLWYLAPGQNYDLKTGLVWNG